MKIKLKKKEVAIIEFLVFLFVFVSKDTLLFGTNRHKIFFGIHVVILLVILIYLMSTVKTIKANTMQYALILCVLFAITTVINFDKDLVKLFYTFLLIGISLFFVSKFDIDDFLNSFLRVMFFFACFTISIFFLAFLFPDFVYMFPKLVNENGFQYSFLGFAAVEIKSTLSLPRMYGIFREPGVYGCFLVLAIFIELFVRNELSTKRIVVLVVATVLTFSTGAYIVLFVLLLLFFLNKFGSGRISQKSMSFLFVLMIILLFFAFLLGIERIASLVFDKFLIDNSSRNARFGAISANLRMFLRNPFLGNGWAYVQSNYISFSQAGLYVSRHNTNTFLKYLAVYGGISFTLLVAGTYRFWFLATKSKSLAYILIFFWMVSLSNEDLSLNIMFYLLSFYGIRGGNSKNKELVN